MHALEIQVSKFSGQVCNLDLQKKEVGFVFTHHDPEISKLQK